MSYARLVLIDNDFILSEKISRSSNPNNPAVVEIVVSKYDVDGMLFVSQKLITQHDYTDNNVYASVITTMGYNVSKLIEKRSRQDTKSCEHETKRLGNTLRCRHCLADLGAVIDFDEKANLN